MPFAEARRILFSIKTLKRQYAAWFFLGAGLIPLAYLLPLFLEKDFGVNELGRGVIGAVNAAATFIGIQLAGRWTIGWMAKGMGEPLKRAGPRARLRRHRHLRHRGLAPCCRWSS